MKLAQVQRMCDIVSDNKMISLRNYGVNADRHWQEVMGLAEQYGFILRAYGGVATLATHQNQLEQMGEPEYLRIQQMNGHCPKDCGYPGCLSAEGELKDCGSCWVLTRGAKWVQFERNKQYGAHEAGR